MGIHLDEHFQIIGGGIYYTLDYIDLEKSVILLSYSYPNHYSEEEEPVVLIGENFEIVEEISLFDYLIEYNWIQNEYDINELIKFYHENLKPNLKIVEVDELALTPKFRQNI